MDSQRLLDKTNRMNMLFDFYRSLLTDKQQQFLQSYFYEDYTLSEIADAAGISRQAVYEHIKRAETSLELYEHKLKLIARYELRRARYTTMLQLLDDNDADAKEEMKAMILELMDSDQENVQSGESNGV